MASHQANLSYAKRCAAHLEQRHGSANPLTDRSVHRPPAESGQRYVRVEITFFRAEADAD
jgi:hypothetical protein